MFPAISKIDRVPRPASFVAGLLLFLWVAFIPTTCASAAPSVAVHDSLATLRPDLSPPSGGEAIAAISAAQNEAESFQLLISSGPTPTEAVSVSADSLVATSGGAVLPSSAITVYREGYYRVTQRSDSEGQAGEWPDVLIPARDPIYGEARSAFPVDLPAAGRLAVWVDVLVPQGQEPGEYQGSLTVQSAGNPPVDVPITLLVRDFSLPSTSTLKSAFFSSTERICEAFTGSSGCGGSQKTAWELQSMFAVLGLNNRITIANAYAGSPTSADFARYMVPLLQGTDPRVSLPGARMTSIEAYWRYCAEAGRDCLSNWRTAAEQYDFADRFFLYVCDEPDGAGAWDRCKETADIAEQKWPGVRKLITGSVGDADSHGASSSADILAPVINYIDSPGAGSSRPSYEGFIGGGANKDVWLYTSCMSYSCDSSESSYWNGWPGYAIDQPSSQARAMGWMAYLYGAGGELYYDTTVSLPQASSDQYVAGGNGDGNLFYAGTPAGKHGSIAIGGSRDIPLESIRLKRIRDSREDYEYLHLAGEQDSAAAVASLARDLFGGQSGTPAKSTTVSSDSLNWTRDSVAGLITGEPVNTRPPAPYVPPAEEDSSDPEQAAVPEPAGSDMAEQQAGEEVESADEDDDLRLQVLKVKVPKSVAQLERQGVRALVRCTVDCRVNLGPELSPGTARRLGLKRAQVGRGSIELEAQRQGWVTARLSRSARAKLIESRAAFRLRANLDSLPV